MSQEIYPRHFSNLLEKALQSYRVINIIGPRQVGKTTMVRDLFKKGVYINLDDDEILTAIEADPRGELESLKETAGYEPVIIDEVQRSKKIALPIKRIVDSSNRKGQFILTGSSNLFATKGVQDSLLGRVVPMQLWPFTVAETKRSPPSKIIDWVLQNKPSLNQIKLQEVLTRSEYIAYLLKGGFPEPRVLPLKEREKFYGSYVKTIVGRDLPEITTIRKADKIHQLINQIAIRTAQEINRNELANSIGLKWETLDSYLDLLTRLNLVIKLGAWTSSEAKREKKQPKYHFIDTGMVCALRRFDETSFRLGSPSSRSIGGLLESFVFNELLRILPFQSRQFGMYHWRNSQKREIDIILERGGYIVGIEVKASRTVALDDFKHLKWFAMTGPGKSRLFKGIVFYLGDKKLSFGDNCYALPVSSLWAEINS